MEKPTPHYDLAAIQAQVARLGAAAFTKTALDGGRDMGLTSREMLAVIAALSRKCRSVRAPQSGDCHQFPPLELAGCTRFAHDRHLAEQSRPIFIPTDEVLPHNATDTAKLL